MTQICHLAADLHFWCKKYGVVQHLTPEFKDLTALLLNKSKSLFTFPLDLHESVHSADLHELL